MADPHLPTEDNKHPSEVVRSFCSLAILLHFLCVFLVLSGNVSPSALQRRLSAVLEPYTATFQFDPALAPFHLTDGSTAGDDHVLEIDFLPPLESGRTNVEETIILPPNENRWSPSRQRWKQLTSEIATYAELQSDAFTGLYAKGVVQYFLKNKGFNHARIRCKRKMTQPLDLANLSPGFPPHDPNAAAYYVLLYEAEAWIDEDGETQLQKRSAGRDAAPTSPESRRP